MEPKECVMIDDGEEERTEAGIDPQGWPPYAFVPGGPWPHPMSPEGHAQGECARTVLPIEGDGWPTSVPFLRGVALFNAGYYWEAHEAWEALWHSHGRRGSTADVLKALIKLAAAGVKVRQRQRHGVMTHAARASVLFETVRAQEGRAWLGLDLDRLSVFAREVATSLPSDPGAREDRVVRVFDFLIEPAPTGESHQKGPGPL